MKISYSQHQADFSEYSVIEQSERTVDLDFDDLPQSEVMDTIEEYCDTQYSQVSYETNAGNYICRFSKKYVYLRFDGVDWEPITRDEAIAGLD